MQQRWGPYTVTGEIGRGGTGVVLRGRGPRGEDVAIKVLRSASADAGARFQREVRLLAKLGASEGFVPLLDSGEVPAPFIVMPFVGGGTLRDRLLRGPLPVEETVALGVSLARSLARAHREGIVHRDVKPENVLFTLEGRPLVADLGLAKHFRPSDGPGDRPSLSLSAPGMMRGTPGYMSPEQLRDSKKVQPATDVFALGAILYECLAGSAPFVADDLLQLIAKIELGRYEPLAKRRADVPGWLARVVDRALARDAEQRYPDAAALADALEARGAGESPGWTRIAAAFLVGAVAMVVVAATAHSMAVAPGETVRTAPSAPLVASPPPPPPRTAPPSGLRARELPAAWRDLTGRESVLELALLLGRPEWKHCERLYAAAFSPDGKTVVSGGAWSTIHLTDAASGADRAIEGGHKGWVRGLAFPDANTVLSASEDATIRIWDLARPGEPRATLTGHKGAVWAIAVSRDGKLAVSASADKTLRLWTLTTNKKLAWFDAHTGEVTGVAFAVEGDRFFSCSLDGSVRAWDIARNESRVLLDGAGPLRAIAVSKERIVVGHKDGGVSLLDMEGRRLAKGVVHAGETLTVAFSPDGRRFASGGADNMIRVFDAATGERVASLAGHVMPVESVAFSPDGKTIVSASEDQTIRLWDPELGVARPGLGAGQRSRITGVALSRDGARAITTSWEPIARVWDVESGAELAALEGHGSWVNGGALSPDGARAATASSDGTARIWDVAKGQVRTRIDHAAAVNAVAWLGADQVVTTCEDGCLRVWDARAGKLLGAASLETPLRKLALSADGRRALVAAADRTARVVDLESLSVVRTLPGHTADVDGVEFLPDGRHALTTSEDGGIRIFDLDGVLEARRYDAGAPCWAAAVTPDGRRIFAVAQGGALHVVDVASLVAIERIELGTATNDFALATAISADGKRLVVGTSRGIALAFNVR